MCLVLIAVCFCLCGCAEVNFVTYHNDDGSITEYVYLSIDENILISHNENPAQIAIEIPTNCYAQAKQLVQEYQSKLFTQYQQNLISNEEYVLYYNSIEIVQQDYNEGNYAIGLKYKNSKAYKKYYETLNNSTFSSNTKEIKKTFYTKTYYYGSANYGDFSIFNTIYNYYTSSRLASISPQETNLTYTYSVSSRRFHSDADNIQLDTNGNYLHTWNISPTEPSRQICFYTISANRSIWIICCIGLSLLTCIIITIVALIKHFKNKSLKPLDNSEVIDNNINIEDSNNNLDA